MKRNVDCLLIDSMKSKPKSKRGARQKTSTPKNVTRMNYNENPYGMSDEVKKAVTDASLNCFLFLVFFFVVFFFVCCLFCCCFFLCFWVVFCFILFIFHLRFQHFLWLRHFY